MSKPATYSKPAVARQAPLSAVTAVKFISGKVKKPDM